MITNEQLLTLMASSGVDINFDNLDANDTFNESGLDSLDVFNFFSEVDDQLGIEVPDEKFEELQTLNKLKDYLNSQRE